MKPYKILFIDEQIQIIEQFEEFFEEAEDDNLVEVITELPKSTLEEMIEHIISINPDIIISDYMLNENIQSVGYNVLYDGVELIEAFEEIRNNFPCFVLTSFDNDAVRKSQDVNKVYIKEVIYDKGVKKEKFINRVISQIKHYQAKIENAKSELESLKKLKSDGKADINDERKLIQLDSFIEKSIDGRSSLPDEFKELSNTDRLERLLSKVDEIINKIGNNE